MISPIEDIGITRLRAEATLLISLSILDLGPAVEEALLPLRLKACGFVVRKADSVLKEVNAALQHVQGLVAVSPAPKAPV